MAQQTINIGASANDGTGDAPRTAFTKVNANFTELYASYREIVTSARTYYVDSAGSDSNTGLSPGVAFATIQKAVSVVSQGLHIAPGITVTISVANGTYSITSPIVLHPVAGAGNILIQGNTGTPANVIVTSASTSAAVPALFWADNPSSCVWQIQGFQIQATSQTKFGIYAVNGGRVDFGTVIFGTGLSRQLHAFLGGLIRSLSSYSITGGATHHYYTATQGIIRTNGITVTLTGTPAFSGEFTRAEGLSTVDARSVTFSGAATGTRYSTVENSLILTGGGGANYFPGSIAGSFATGGQYT